MVCLPFNDPNQYDLFDPTINFPPVPSTAFPPNMEEIMLELNNPNAFLPSPNITEIEKVEAALGAGEAFWLAEPPSAERTSALELFGGIYDFGANPLFNQYTGQYNAAFPPLISNTGGIQDILNTLRTHLNGIPTTIPGALGSLGQANALRSMSYGNAGNILQQSLGLGAIPDCGLFDKLLGLLKDLLQPLIDLLAALIKPLVELIAALLGILAAILKELLDLLNLLQRILNFAGASQLLNLDPCALLNMAQIGTPSLNTAVNEGIAWKDPDATSIPEPGEFF